MSKLLVSDYMFGHEVISEHREYVDGSNPNVDKFKEFTPTNLVPGSIVYVQLPSQRIDNRGSTISGFHRHYYPHKVRVGESGEIELEAIDLTPTHPPGYGVSDSPGFKRKLGKNSIFVLKDKKT